MKVMYWFAAYLIIGLWLAVSPYVLKFSHMPEAYWNSLVLGILMALTSAVAIYYWRGEHEKTQLGHKKAA
jgi:hypothetical protein